MSHTRGSTVSMDSNVDTVPSCSSFQNATREMNPAARFASYSLRPLHSKIQTIRSCPMPKPSTRTWPSMPKPFRKLERRLIRALSISSGEQSKAMTRNQNANTLSPDSLSTNEEIQSSANCWTKVYSESPTSKPPVSSLKK